MTLINQRAHGKKSFVFLKLCAALCLPAFLFFSCSRAEPKIEYGFIGLYYYPPENPDGGVPSERYTFFVIPQDDDGIENLGELSLYHDREGLCWNFGDRDWVRVEEEGRTWIGSRNIAMPEGGLLPRGQFRAVLINKGGEKTERSFTFDGPEDPRYPYPFFSFTEGRFRIDSQYPVNRFICYDQHGAEVQIVNVPYPEGTLRDIEVKESVLSMALWAEDPERRTSALTEAVLVR